MAAYNALHRAVLVALFQPPRRPLRRQLREPHGFSAAVLEAASRQPRATDFIIGVAISVDHHPRRRAVARRCSRRSRLARRPRTHTTTSPCGTGSYFDFTQIIPTFLYADKLGAPYRRGREAGGEARPGAGREPYPHARERRLRHRLGPGRHGLDRARPDRRSAYGRTRRAPAAPSDIRPCISCNQMCWGRRSRDYWISCLVNPSVGPRVPMGRRPLRAGRGGPKHVLVVGGGPAGLEAARVAAERGHRVTLVEAAARARRAVPPGRRAAAPRPDHRSAGTGTRAS